MCQVLQDMFMDEESADIVIEVVEVGGAKIETKLKEECQDEFVHIFLLIE